MALEQGIALKASLPAYDMDLADVKQVIVKLKNFHELSTGDIFKATVLDIQPSQVSIRLSGGGDITAKTLVLPDARIGDETLFAVKENKDGQILLEMLKLKDSTLKENIAKEALASAKIHPTGENVKLVKTLMDNNLPIDAASLQKAVFFHYSSANLPLEKIIFLMKENFPMAAVNIELLGKLMEPGGFTQKLFDTVFAFKNLDPAARSKIAEFFLPALESSSPEFAKTLKAALESGNRNISMPLIAEKLMFALKNKYSLNRLPDFFKELHKALAETERLLETKSDKSALKEQTTALRQQLEFIEHINNYKEYIQIPLNSGDAPKNAELFVFKNPNKKKNTSERASVLIALDFDNLGRVETFIELQGKSISFQFRAAYPETVKLLGANFSLLEDMLVSSGYTLSGAVFKHMDEAFSILDDIGAPDTKEPEKKRYSFDMRV